MNYDNVNEIVLNYICNVGFPLQLKSNWWRIMMTVLFVGTPWRLRGSCRVVIFFTSKASCRYQCRLLPFHFENLPCVKRTCVIQNWSYFSCLLISNNTAVEASALTLMSRIASSSMDTYLNKHLKVSPCTWTQLQYCLWWRIQAVNVTKCPSNNYYNPQKDKIINWTLF